MNENKFNCFIMKFLKWKSLSLRFQNLFGTIVTFYSLGFSSQQSTTTTTGSDKFLMQFEKAPARQACTKLDCARKKKSPAGFYCLFIVVQLYISCGYILQHTI